MSKQPTDPGPIPAGKLPAELLARLLERYVRPDPSVLLGPGIGRDAAIVDLGHELCLVAKTDPVTFATEDIGWYAVHVNANDLACCGARPRWFLATLLLPEGGTGAALAEAIFGQVAEACDSLGVTLCGGHTEITVGLERPIVCGQMLGEVARERWVSAAGAREGDTVILTKGFALEGTALLARERRDELAGVLGQAALERSAAFLRDPGISVVRDAELALAAGGVHALHDPTEGGVATGLHELARASEVGLSVDPERLPVRAECARVCAHFGLDPLGLIASGTLIVTAEAARANAVLERLRAGGVEAMAVGTVVPASHGVRLVRADGRCEPLPVFARDELARLLEE